MVEDKAVVEARPVVVVDKKKEDSTILAKFLSVSGYKESDVLSYNSRTSLFVTSNGGKYQLTKGGRIRRLAGPEFPKETKAEDE